MIKARNGCTIATSNNLVLVFCLLALSAFTSLIFIRNRSQQSCRIPSLKNFAKVVGKSCNHDNLLKKCLRTDVFLWVGQNVQNLFLMEYYQSTAFGFCTFMSRFRHPQKIMIWFSWKLSCLSVKKSETSVTLVILSCPSACRSFDEAGVSFCYFLCTNILLHAPFFIYFISR